MATRKSGSQRSSTFTLGFQPCPHGSRRKSSRRLKHVPIRRAGKRPMQAGLRAARTVLKGPTPLSATAATTIDRSNRCWRRNVLPGCLSDREKGTRFRLRIAHTGHNVTLRQEEEAEFTGKAGCEFRTSSKLLTHPGSSVPTPVREAGRPKT